MRVYTDSRLQVPAGGSVAVALTLIDSHRGNWLSGNSKDEFTFYITSPPQQGRLSSVQQFSRKSTSDQALVFYTHTGRTISVSEDTFAYEARDQSGRHRLAGVAKISILQPRLEVEPSGKMVFESLIAGERATRQIQIKNLSEIKINGNLVVDAPFSVGNPFYEILPWSKKVIEINCYSSIPGFYQSKLRLSSHPNLSYVLQTRFLSSLLFSPEQLDLGSQVRKNGPLGKIELYNRGKTSQQVRLHVQPPFQIIPEALTIPGQSKRSIRLQVDKKVEGNFSEKIIATSDRAMASAQIKLNWLSEPKLEIINSLDLGKAFQATTNFIFLINRSQLLWQGQVSISGAFYLKNTHLAVRAGETQAVAIIFNPSFTGKFEEELILTEKSYGAVQKFLVKAESVRSFQAHASISNPVFGRSSFLKPEMSKTPKLPLLGIFYTMPNPEVAVIKWKSSDPASLHRLYQKRWQWNAEKTGLIEEWYEIDDVECQIFDENMIGFRVDRLRPNWRYTFAVYQTNSESQQGVMSDEIEIVTPLINSTSKSFSWLFGGAALFFILIFIWFFKTFRRGFGSFS